jgi:hypothetical protein
VVTRPEKAYFHFRCRLSCHPVEPFLKWSEKKFLFFKIGFRSWVTGAGILQNIFYNWGLICSSDILNILTLHVFQISYISMYLGTNELFAVPETNTFTYKNLIFLMLHNAGICK